MTRTRTQRPARGRRSTDGWSWRWAEWVTTPDRIFVLSALHDAGRMRTLVTRVRWQAALLLDEPCITTSLPWFCGGAPYSALLAGVPHVSISATLPPGRACRGIGRAALLVRAPPGRSCRPAPGRDWADQSGLPVPPLPGGTGARGQRRGSRRHLGAW